jgi:type I restriction enzyme S subunit
MSPLYTVFKFKDRNDDFYAHYFKTTGWHAYMRQASSTGARHDRMAISSDDFIAMPMPVASPEEQQKIADCLSSVDELISAQTRKLDVLMAHKKGLMQKLFPGERETQPLHRFPEFKKAGEWKERTFSDLCDIKHGYAFESEFFRNDGDYVLLTPGNFYEQGGYRDRGEQQKYYTGQILRDYVLAKGDMLVAMTEQAAGLLGSPILVPESGKFLHNQRLGLVAKKPGVAWANEFFFHVFNTQTVRKAIHDTASGAKVRHTSPTKIGEVAISVPTSLPEQQRIADCLTSLDDLIAAHAQKIGALKTHKKGMMQQLFPSPEEVEA